jgi:hypothetical protein
MEPRTLEWETAARGAGRSGNDGRSAVRSAIVADPVAWISRRLEDLPSMLVEAGHAELVGELDGDAVSQAMPAILAAIETTLAYRPGVASRSD